MVRTSAFSCVPLPFDQSREWRFEDGILRHMSGGFFAVAGLVTEARCAALDRKEQLILLQPQSSIIGFLMRRAAGRRELLFQGRVEPGNVGVMQLAPTVQSTEANYKQLHGGGPTPFIEWFTKRHVGRVIIDELQSEEGTRYYGKSNRNVVIEVPADVELELAPNFRWYSVETLRPLAASSNVINTDARSVLASVQWDELADEDGPFAHHEPGSYGAALRESYVSNGDQSIVETLRWLMQLRVRCSLRSRVLPVHALDNWTIDRDAIREKRRDAGFAVRHFTIVARGREVPSWDQPLVDSGGPGRIVLVSQQRCGVLRFLLKASHEIGFLEGVQLSASVCVQPGQDTSRGCPLERELVRRVAELNGATVHAECHQSEEGGRFYQDENCYQIVELDEDVSLSDSDDHRWLTLGQIRQLICMPGVLAIELRGALAILLSWL